MMMENMDFRGGAEFVDGSEEEMDEIEKKRLGLEGDGEDEEMDDFEDTEEEDN